MISNELVDGSAETLGDLHSDVPTQILASTDVSPWTGETGRVLKGRNSYLLRVSAVERPREGKDENGDHECANEPLGLCH